MDLLDAARRMVRTYPGGCEAMAARLGKSPETLDKELRGSKGFKLGAIDAGEISTMCYDLGLEDALAFATALAARMGCLLVPLPRDGAAVATAAVMEMASAARQSAELLAETSACLADGRVSDNELRRVRREGAEVVEAVQRLLSALAALNAAGKPAGVA